ncbi:MAG: NAD(P)/FAD-dependent oxidoreductase [Anaerolineae bacterium]|nr:NAD(P)/FAD-dependent oxidoreductase [Anaerolineae bacterium]
MRHVIIGNSAAAVGAIEAIRRYDLDSPITVLSNEPHHVYSRPLISYLLGGLVDESRMNYRPHDFYDRFNVQTMLGVEVLRVEPQQKQLALQGGGTLGYDKLLIATGGKPFTPPMPGSNLEGIFTFTTWDDARRMAHYIETRPVKSALVLGGGLIGLKTAEALMARKIQVTMVELSDRILSATFDRTASKLAESLLRRENVEIRMGNTVEEIIGRNGYVDHAVLRDGERINCDMVVFAIGVRPNTGLIPQEAGIRIDRGICVDDRMRTTVDDVYGAGDCVETYDALTGTSRSIAIWPNAYRQGYVAGHGMAGVAMHYDAHLVMNSIEVCGVPTISVGLTDPPAGEPGYEVLERYDRSAPTYKKLVMRDQCLVGAIFIGAIQRAGIYTGLIRDQVNVSAFQQHLLSGNFGLISLPKDYRKHLVVGGGIEV